ncbi:pyridoxamine 5'-phosphate oxidase family protein [uncultured Sphaerochaeta sp.]|uniref:pyridoxamine 5'-phosphate oxidase family protein n=1 Tax=uncultured Sphaerochaeta sp. TaxID=886478 RepID=UPI0029CA5E69|nr:pyridoxamine 5'-phosphate oxidase family protein [uncultured Sphaerochaeta sp.]
MLPNTIIEAWKSRQPAVVLTTVDESGMPNSIYATCTDLYQDTEIVIANNYFDKTKHNIDMGTKASVLFITEEGKSYQLKGEVSYHTEGAYYDFMKAFNPVKHPGHGALVLHAQAGFSGQEQLF